LKAAVVAVVLLLLVVQSAVASNTVATIGKLSEQESFEAFSRCNDLGDAGDLMWDGSSIVSRSGIQYAAVEVTKLVYGGGVPSEIGLKGPVSIDGVTFFSPSPESFTATILLGVLFINIIFADGTERDLSAIVFLPPIKDGTPQGCALLVTHKGQQAGFVVIFTPSSEPLDNPALRYETLGKVFQCRLYLIVRANVAATTTTVMLPPTNPQTTNATLEYDLANRLTKNGTMCTYECGPMFAVYRTGDRFSFNFSSTSPIDVYVFDPEAYGGIVSCAFGPILNAPDGPLKLTGKQDTFATECLGCEKEGGKASSFYVLFINHDPTATPHVTLQVAVVWFGNSISLQGVSLYRSTPGTYPNPYLSAMIIVNATVPLSSLQLFINGTDEGTTPYTNTMTNYADWFKAMPSNPAMPIMAGKTYAITLIATFEDNSTFTASVSVVALAGSQAPGQSSASTQTTYSPSITTSVTAASVPFLDFPAVVIAIVLGFFLLTKLRRRRI
jgi:hypothetical protein